jgi:hypothetical protein
MLIPVIVGLGIVSIFKGKNKADRTGQMTPERTHLFQSALNSSVLAPKQLETLADAFHAQGLPAEAILLRKRAKLRGMSPEEKRIRADIFRKALASKDPDAVERVAAVYESQGATGSAKRLRMLAISLRTVKEVKPVPPAAPPAPAPAPAEVIATDDEAGQAAASAAQPASSDESGDGISEQQEPTEAERTQLK